MALLVILTVAVALVVRPASASQSVGAAELVARKGCTMWRQTTQCSPLGPREPANDKPCSAQIPSIMSGYCECAGGVPVSPVACGHAPLTCDQACAGLGWVITARNGFVSASFPLLRPAVHVSADFSGTGNYSLVTLFDGIRTERIDADGKVHSSSDGAPEGSIYMRVLSNASALVAVEFSGIVDDAHSPVLRDTWALQLAQGARSLTLNFTGAPIHSPQVRCIRHSLYGRASSIYGLFANGVAQMRDGGSAPSLRSTNPLERVYAMGGGSAYDILPIASTGIAHHAIVSESGSGVVSSSAFHQVHAGEPTSLDTWDGGSYTGTVAASQGWNTSISLAPNNRNFPTQGLTVAANLPSLDLEALLTGAYGSPVGCLDTFDNEVAPGQRVGQIGTSIHRPDQGYQGTYNYFDPDNYIGLTALLYTGDAYLQEQARVVIERSGAFLRPSGQLPHHFQGVTPTYLALSGETQTGPNVFWTLTALNYARNSGNLQWLQSYMPTLRKAAGFCTQLVEPGMGLLNAPGSLMIDVFIRNHYTSDSNAMMVGFLRAFADAEDAVGNATGAATLRNLSSTVAASINKYLWARQDDDHYVTQLNPDNTTRDFVDYDANLIAVAHAVPDRDRALRLLKRVDGGRCTHSKATWVSEKYYGTQDTTNGNVGDSWTAMARIGLFDARARKQVGDLATFDNVILAPLQQDVIEFTWLRERYGCDGKQQMNRTEAYFEYPAAVAMMLREVRYGIDLGFTAVTVDPFGPKAFSYHVGNVHVDYAPDRVALSVPGSGPRAVTVTQLLPSRRYAVVTAGMGCGSPLPFASTDAAGVLRFTAPAGQQCTTTATATATATGR